MLARTTARECYRILRDDRGCYVFVNWRSLSVWLDALASAGFRLKNVIVWDKIIHGLNYQNYVHTHEFLIFAAKGRFPLRTKERVTIRAATSGASAARRGRRAHLTFTMRR